MKFGNLTAHSFASLAQIIRTPQVTDLKQQFLSFLLTCRNTQADFKAAHICLGLNRSSDLYSIVTHAVILEFLLTTMQLSSHRVCRTELFDPYCNLHY